MRLSQPLALAILVGVCAPGTLALAQAEPTAQVATPRYVDGRHDGGQEGRRAERVLVMLGYDLGGLLGAPLAGAAVGALVGLALGPLGAVGVAYYGAIVAEGLFVLLMPLLDTWAGDEARGRGNVAAAYLGYALGLGLGAALVAGAIELAPELHDREGRMALLATAGVLAGLCALAGPIVGYEVADADARVDPILAPTASVTQDGASLGLVGAF